MTIPTESNSSSTDDLSGEVFRHEQALAAQEAAALLMNAGMDSAAEFVLRLAREKELPQDAFQEREFFRDTYLVTVIRDEPGALEDLGEISHAIKDGDYTGQFQLVATEALDHDQARQACLEVGTDPGFFQALAEDAPAHSERG